MITTDKTLKEIAFKFSAYELAAEVNPNATINAIKDAIDRAWDETFGDDNER